jgi:hypothetical protein
VGSEWTTEGADKLEKLAARTGAAFVAPNLVQQVDRLFDPTVYDQSGPAIRKNLEQLLPDLQGMSQEDAQRVVARVADLYHTAAKMQLAGTQPQLELEQSTHRWRPSRNCRNYWRHTRAAIRWSARLACVLPCSPELDAHGNQATDGTKNKIPNRRPDGV